jgi:hypothetical protein
MKSYLVTIIVKGAIETSLAKLSEGDEMTLEKAIDAAKEQIIKLESK